MLHRVFICLLSLSIFSTIAAHAETREYDLVVAKQKIEIDGVVRNALTINGGVPAPTLRFTLGDEAVIRVHNTLDVSTSLHWHGLLLPNAEDGVPYLTTPPIEPGTTFVYRFPIRQTGTYWYHSHSGLQEQQGMYGAIVIDEPRDAASAAPALREEVLVLSDWTDENPVDVLRTLMRGSDWYAMRKGNFPTLFGAIANNALDEYIHREWSRMAPMDLSDVAYDAFLVNGQSRVFISPEPGERIRLRIVNASAASYFYVQFAGGQLQLIAADGMDVAPTEVSRLLIAIGETYDAIITMPAQGAWEFRATAQDGSGHASALFGSGTETSAPLVPNADIYRMDAMLESGMESSGAMKMDDDAARPPPPYRHLHARDSTAFAADLPRRDLTLRLTGDMERYFWSINGLTIDQESTIPVTKGEVLRFTLVNDTMMHHPMHLHGHFFRVIGEQGDHAPLKHTIDVPPMGRRVIEFEANEEGDWFFHCHLLYHMEMGMGRVVTYAGPDHVPSLEPTMENTPFFMLDATVLSNMTMGEARIMRGVDGFGVDWDVGYMKEMEGMDDMGQREYEVDALWTRYFNPNFSTKAGARFTNEQDEEITAFAGIDYRLPLLIVTHLEIDSEGDGRFGAEKSIDLFDRLSFQSEFYYDTSSRWDWRLGFDYALTKSVSLTTLYDSQHGFGIGCTFRF